MLGYCASKAGLNALMDGLRVELRGTGVQALTMCPGWIRTPMTAPLQGRVARMLDVEPAAARILTAIRRNQRRVYFPASLAWPLRLLRWLPLDWQDALLARAGRSHGVR
jgi:short-subunit dehydrogenase